MTTIEGRRYEMLVRVREFGEAHRDRFPESSAAGQALATVSAAVTQVGGHAVSKLKAVRSGKGMKAVARVALIDQLDAIGRTARVLGERIPGLDAKFQRPRPQTDQALLTAGQAFAQEAEAYKSEFVAHGLPETFLATLNERVEAFAQAIRHRQAGKDAEVAARASIEAALESGTAAVRTLDVIIANQLHADPVTLAVWERDRRVVYPHGRSAASSENEPAPAADPVNLAAASVSTAALPANSAAASPRG